MRFNSITIRYYFDLIMGLIYLSVGILFLFTNIAIDNFPEYRIQVGGLLIAYALFRFYTSTKKIKQKNAAAE
jgi:hypothetical protein